MHPTLEQLDNMLRRVDIGGLTDVSFGGQIVNNEWHATDCDTVGTTNNPLGPFPWSFIQEKMTAGCCLQDTFHLAGELVPQTLTNAIRFLDAVDRTYGYVNLYTKDISSTPILDLNATDAAIEFDSDLAEMTGSLYTRLVRVSPRHIAPLAVEAEQLEEAVNTLRSFRFREPGFIDDLYKQVHKEIGVQRDDTPVVASFCGFLTKEKPGSWSHRLLNAVTLVFATDAWQGRTIATLPRWAYQALCELGGDEWVTKPHVGLDPAVEETARALWVHTPDAPMYNFDTCVQAATTLCAETIKV
jgi:hypothetical protein